MAWFVEPIQTTDGAPSVGHRTRRRRLAARLPPPRGRGLRSASTPKYVLQLALLPEQMSVLVAQDVSAPGRGGLGRSRQFIVVDAEPVAEVDDWQALPDDACPLTIPAHSHRRVVLDLEDYVCAYPQVQLSGRAWQSGVGWAEALHLDATSESKGQRVMRWRAKPSSKALCRDVIVELATASAL
ncbi:MAG: hypothetical protein R2838_09565 [Caldilineaceae bacterium]